MKRSVLYIFTLMLLSACTPSVPSQYIQPGDMEDILYDYHVAQAMVRTKGGSNTELEKRNLMDAVLKKHEVSQADFDSSLVYYYTRADRLKDIYRDVSERLSENAQQLGAAVSDLNLYSQYSATGDTANIWNQASNVLLIPRPTHNRFDFTIKVDTSFYLGDSFMFQFMSEYLYQSGARDALVCLLTKYEGDSIIQTTNHVTVSGQAQIRVPANNKNKLKEFSGFIYLGDGGEKNDTRKLLFISQIQLIRFHNKTLKNADETVQEDSVQTDSVQRVDKSRRPMPDTLRRRIVGGRPGGPPLPPNRGIGPHRMDKGPVKIDKRPK